MVLHGCSGSAESIWNGRYDRLGLELNPTHLAKLTEGRFAGAMIDFVDRWSFSDERLEYLLRVLHAELQLGAPNGRLFGEQVGNAIAMLLARQYATVKPGAYGISGRIPPARLTQVLDYIEAHLDQQTHLSDLAETASMSPFYFARLFKNSVGVSPHKYVTMRRIKRAKELLQWSSMSVLEIGPCRLPRCQTFQSDIPSGGWRLPEGVPILTIVTALRCPGFTSALIFGSDNKEYYYQSHLFKSGQVTHRPRFGGYLRNRSPETLGLYRDCPGRGGLSGAKSLGRVVG
jgi:AraC family transcriptional regulator